MKLAYRILSRVILAVSILGLLSSSAAARPQIIRHYKNGMWTGMNRANNATAIFNVVNSQINHVHFGGLEVLCFETNGNMYEWSVTLGEHETELLHIPASGRLDVGWEIQDGAYRGVEVGVTGRLNGNRGTLHISIHSQSDLVTCDATNDVPVRWARARWPRGS